MVTRGEVDAGRALYKEVQAQAGAIAASVLVPVPTPAPVPEAATLPVTAAATAAPAGDRAPEAGGAKDREVAEVSSQQSSSSSSSPQTAPTRQLASAGAATACGTGDSQCTPRLSISTGLEGDPLCDYESDPSRDAVETLPPPEALLIKEEPWPHLDLLLEAIEEEEKKNNARSLLNSNKLVASSSTAPAGDLPDASISEGRDQGRVKRERAGCPESQPSRKSARLAGADAV